MLTWFVLNSSSYKVRVDCHDGRCSQGFSWLICSNCVILKAKIREHQEATERQRKRSHFEHRQPFWLKNIEESAQAETNIRGGKVDTCKSHVREAMVNMEPFVQENDANRGTYVNE